MQLIGPDHHDRQRHHCYAGALHPRTRPFAIYDATISYPLRSDTIPAWVAIVVPFILMLISLFIGEFILFKKVGCCCFLLLPRS